MAKVLFFLPLTLVIIMVSIFQSKMYINMVFDTVIEVVSQHVNRKLDPWREAPSHFPVNCSTIRVSIRTNYINYVLIKTDFVFRVRFIV